MKLSEQPYWTDADAAELEQLTFEFVRAVLAHRKACEHCNAGRTYCADLRTAWDALDEWRQFLHARGHDVVHLLRPGPQRAAPRLGADLGDARRRPPSVRLTGSVRNIRPMPFV